MNKEKIVWFIDEMDATARRCGKEFIPPENFEEWLVERAKRCHSLDRAIIVTRKELLKELVPKEQRHRRWYRPRSS